ncbi:MAG: dTMP kinase [Clostridiales bacterium]|jgi:dTMP kinase|nr:dTMP kinase [Clostridiales bacterium]
MFVTIEGCERVGKSTYIEMLKEYLLKRGIADKTLFTREPGGSPIAERIRGVILDPSYLGRMSAHTEALLYAAARCQHIDETILPALRSGKNVVCDRYIHSSYAYQAFARGLGKDCVESLNMYAVKNCMPDAVLFIDLSHERAYSREDGQNDRMELEAAEFHKRVYEGFKELERTEKNFYTIKPTGKEETFLRITEILEKIGFFKLKIEN